MFKTFLYYNADRINEYYSIIGKKSKGNVKMTRTTQGGINLIAPVIGGGINRTVTTESVPYEGRLAVFSDLERALNGTDEYYDMLSSDDFTLASILRGSIVHFPGYVSVPESFDIFETIAKDKSAFLAQIVQNLPKEGADFFRAALIRKEIDYPVIIELDDAAGYAILSQKYLTEDFDGFESDDELIVLARVVNQRDGEVTIFDPVKEMFNFNRTIRKSFDDTPRPSGLEKIVVDGPITELEIIAVYR